MLLESLGSTVNSFSGFWGNPSCRQQPEPKKTFSIDPARKLWHTPWANKNVALYFCPYLCQLL